MPAEHIITRIKQIEERIQEIQNFTHSSASKKIQKMTKSNDLPKGDKFSEILQEVMTSRTENKLNLAKNETENIFSSLENQANSLMEEYKNKGFMPTTQPRMLYSTITSSKNPGIWNDSISDIAEKLDLDPHLIHAIIQTESGYNPHAVSKTGAKGLMQLMPNTAKEMGVINAFDPLENISGGSLYLKQLLNRYKGDLVKSIAAYNAGPEAVDMAKGIPRYEETQAYVPKVLNHYYKIRNTGDLSS